MKKVNVKLKKGHPKRVMRAMLTDGSVVVIDEVGLDIAAELVGRDVTRCGWFRHEGTKEEQEQEKPEEPEELETLTQSREEREEEPEKDEPVEPAKVETPKAPRVPRKKAVK